MFSYRSLLKQAWNIIWKHKYLWFFGLFASLTAIGGSVEYQLIAQKFSQNLVNSSYDSLNGIILLGEILEDLYLGIIQVFQYDFWSILNAITFSLISLTLLFVFIWLAITSQAALVYKVKRILSPKKKTNDLGIRQGLTVGHQHFWTVLGLNILIKILISLAFFIISLPLLFMLLNDTSVLVVAYTILFVVFVPVAVSLSLLVKYAIAYHVLNGKPLVASLEAGWKLFKNNWLVSLEMAIILFIINFLVSLGILLLLSIFVFPLFWMSLILQMTGVIMVTLLVSLVVVVILGSGLTAFQISAWTSLFLRLEDSGATAKLERIFKKRI